MKKIALCLAAIMVFSLTVTGCKSVKENPVTDFEYTVNENQVYIRGYIGESNTVVIPEEIEGMPVTVISNAAFVLNKNITSVTIPDSVKTIFDSAFWGCSSLKEVNFGKGIKEVGPRAFEKCTSLEKVIIPKGVEAIGFYAFSECSSVKEIYIPNTVTKIGECAFFKNESATKIEIEDGITEIGEYMFASATSLETVTIPAGVEEICMCAFVGCTKLESVKFLGDAPKTVGNEVFGFGQDKKELKVYYKKGASGWDNTPLADEYTLIQY